MVLPSPALSGLDQNKLAKASAERAKKALGRIRSWLASGAPTTVERLLDLDEATLLLAINARRDLQLRNCLKSRESVGSKDSPDVAKPLDCPEDLGLVLNKVVHHIWLHPFPADPQSITGFDAECDRRKFTRFDLADLCSACETALTPTSYPGS